MHCKPNKNEFQLRTIPQPILQAILDAIRQKETG